MTIPRSPTPSMPLQERRSQRATRIAFGIIIAFVLAQAGWWILFEFRSIERVTNETLAAWQRDAAFADALVERDAALAEPVLSAYPHLVVEDQGTRPGASVRFIVDPEHLAAFEAKQRSQQLMFAFEGPTFALVVLSLLLFIAASLRSERKLQRRQQNFLSAVTHEFKTPISTLRLLVQTVLMRTMSPDKQRDYLERMEAELDRLERTSEQVLASARLEQSTVPPALHAAELNHVVQGLIGRARGGLEARGAVLTIDYSPEPIPVSIDGDGLSVVVNNLLDNAVKYSSGGRKPIRVSLESHDGIVEIHVDDEGIGLKEGEERIVFERFYRVGDEITRESSGIGLGLYLVKSITEGMNGWVRAGPNPDAPQGSRFTVVLPRRLAVESPPTTNRQPTRVRIADGRGRTR